MESITGTAQFNAPKDLFTYSSSPNASQARRLLLSFTGQQKRIHSSGPPFPYSTIWADERQIESGVPAHTGALFPLEVVARRNRGIESQPWANPFDGGRTDPFDLAQIARVSEGRLAFSPILEAGAEFQDGPRPGRTDAGQT